MITFKEFLLEDKDEFVKLIERDCDFFFRESGRRGLLYRGVRDLYDEHAKKVDDMLYWEKAVRQDRRPRHMKRTQSDEVDAWFKENFGFGARSQAMFCFGQTADRQSIAQYGAPCVVFPVGEFKYVWSNRVADLYSEIDENEDVDEYDPGGYLDDLNYIDNQLNVAVRKNKEIMIACKSYYAFKIDDSEEAIRDALDIRNH